MPPADPNIPSSAWARAAVLVELFNVPDGSPVQTPSSGGKRKAADSPDGARARKRKKSNNGQTLQARFSPYKGANDIFTPAKPDDAMRAGADRIFEATGSRRHVLGIYAKAFDVSFYVYDHAGTIYTSPLDLRTHALDFISAIICLSLLDPIALGLEPIFAASSTLSPSSLLQTPEYICAGTRRPRNPSDKRP